jgi:hypothetical protein
MTHLSGLEKGLREKSFAVNCEKKNKKGQKKIL